MTIWYGPPTPPVEQPAIVSITTTSSNTAGIVVNGIGGYWLDGVWYPTPQQVDYPTHWYQPMYPQPLQPPVWTPNPLKLPDIGQTLDAEQLKKLLDALMAGQSNPTLPSPFQEAAKEPEPAPEPAQDLTRPFQRKLDLDD